MQFCIINILFSYRNLSLYTLLAAECLWVDWRLPAAGDPKPFLMGRRKDAAPRYQYSQLAFALLARHFHSRSHLTLTPRQVSFLWARQESQPEPFFLISLEKHHIYRW